MASNIDDIIQKFDSFTQKPVNFLTVQTGVREDIKGLVKSIYDYTKAEEQSEKKAKKAALPELIVEDFDEEQIWQEIDLQNSERWDQLVWEVANCMSSTKDLVFPVDVASKKKDNETDRSVVASDEELDEANEKPKKSKAKSKKRLGKTAEANEADSENNSESDTPRKTKKSKSNKHTEGKGKTSIVDDEFFKLSEMEKFLLDEEKKDGKKVASDSDEESPPLFEDIDEDEGDKNMMYTDFFENEEGNGEYGRFDNDELDESEDDDGGEMEEDFFNESKSKEKDDDHSDKDDDEIDQDSEHEQTSKKVKKKKVTFADGSSDDDSEDSADDENAVPNQQLKDEKKSEFELRQQRLQQHISRLEDKNIKDAPWQLKGEVDATKRPQNSLLQEVVDFDLTSRPAPIITEQTTITLEDIIRRRVKDKAWDDVIRKVKPVEDQLSFRKTEIIDQSKSKLSLAQVYEAEYLKQKQALSGDVEDEKEPESHTQIRDSMNRLFSKLDALCHYHYTPKAPQAEVKIVSNTPAISMEEVAPVATSEAALLAPEEVKKKRRGDLMSKEERTQTDKNRERRKKKKLQRKKGQVTKVTDNRNTKKATEASDKSLKTSKAFFQQLNDDSNSLMKNKRNVKNKGQ